MSLENRIRMIAGILILFSLALARWLSPHWLWFTAFIGLSLFQSAFTNWCMMANLLRKIGLGGSGS